MHWRVAARGAVLTLALAVAVGLAFGYYLGWDWVLAFLYGVGVGLVCFASIALTVSLLTVRPSGLRAMLGATSYAGRLAFGALAVVVPIYLGVWPALPVVVGVIGVYMVENVVLLLLAPKTLGRQNAPERRAEA